MAGFADILLRGLILVLGSLALGGVVWLRIVLRAEPHAKPDGPAAIALRAVALAAAGVAAAQALVLLVSLGALVAPDGAWPVGDFFATTFARAAAVRAAWAGAVAALAWAMAGRAAGRLAWLALAVGAAVLVASSAVLSHAMARVDSRAVLVGLDAAHQVAAAVWVGGLAHLTLYAAWRRRHAAALATWPDAASRASGPLLRRFSSVAFWSMAVIVAAGLGLTWLYVGDAAAFVGTAYGVMIVSKVILLLAALCLAYVNMRAVRAAVREPGVRLFRFVEVELGLAVTILFAAASLTSLPPAIDVTTDRASVAEVAARFVPAPPRLTSPPIAELLHSADPLMGRQLERKPVERAWSEYNHHWAGLFVVTMGALAMLERLGVRAARHWPLVFLGLATFLFVRNDPRAWPLGPAGFWESLTLPDVLQHRTFVLLVVAFAFFEWMVRTGRLPQRPSAFVFPVLCAVGGGLLLTHSHAMFSLKDEFLTEVTHAPLGVLGAFAGWGRWLELRLPEAGRWPGWTWRACFAGVGLLLLFYREG
ncbi:MAG TPA: CopD family protein [Methylomirabilota bacterium]|jgi:putative copper resistance protein D|nr:CopD family protein [Methylomirabilota bacterium]